MVNKRHWAMLLGGLALVTLFLLASALPELTFKPGKAFDLGLRQLRAMQTMPPMLEGSGIIVLFRIIFTLGLILLPIYIIYMLISPARRKQFLGDLLRMALFLTLFYLIAQARSDVAPVEELVPARTVAEVPEGAGAGLPPLPEFVPTTPNWLVYTISLLLALVVTAVVVSIAWTIWKRKQQEESTLDALIQEAQDVLAVLQAGGDLKDAVLRCYFEMTRILHDRRGIQRGRAMTTREFEERLIAEGLPGSPVRQLTRLFESVRYGAESPGKAEEQQAIMCLQAIIDAAGGDEPIAPSTSRSHTPPTSKASRHI